MIANGSTTNRLYRSRQDKKIAGVAAGIGQYLNVEPLLVRLAFVLFTIAPYLGGFAVITYVVLALLLPERPADENDPQVTSGIDRTRGREIAGWALVGFGMLLLAGSFGLFRMLDWDRLWPLALVGFGLLLVVRRAQN